MRRPLAVERSAHDEATIAVDMGKAAAISQKERGPPGVDVQSGQCRTGSRTQFMAYLSKTAGSFPTNPC